MFYGILKIDFSNPFLFSRGEKRGWRKRKRRFVLRKKKTVAGGQVFSRDGKTCRVGCKTGPGVASALRSDCGMESPHPIAPTHVGLENNQNVNHLCAFRDAETWGGAALNSEPGIARGCDSGLGWEEEGGWD